MDTSFIPSDIQEVMARLHDSGFAVWLVGGALRDALRGKPPEDWDLATDATPEEIMGLFTRVIPIGIRHGTVQIHTAKRDIEATSYTARGPQGILPDLARRDFTINAMALGFPGGELLDPHGGQEDLRLGRLRAVGSPVARFREDPLRTLRAGRFMSGLGFQLHAETRAALQQTAAGLAQVAVERVRAEMSKLLMGRHFLPAMNCMKETGVLSYVLPELLEQDGGTCTEPLPDSRYHHTLLTVQHAPPRHRVRLAALLHALGRPWKRSVTPDCCAAYSQSSAHRAGLVMLRWRMSRKGICQTAKLIANQPPWTTATWTDADARRLIAAAGIDLLEDLFDLTTADCLAWGGKEQFLLNIASQRSRVKSQLGRPLALHIEDLAIDGRTVMHTLDLPPGPRIGTLLQELLAMVIEDPSLNEHQTLKAILVRKHG